jgi:hypothetical protein
MSDERGMVDKGNSPFSFPSMLPSKPIYRGNAQYPIGEFPMSEVNTIQTQLDLPRCRMCGRIVNHTLHSHHAIPRYMECSGDEDIIQVCKSCHKRADTTFDRFVLDPFGRSRGSLWHDRVKAVENRRNNRKNISIRTLFVETFCCARCYVYVELQYNRRTGNIGIYDYITSSNARPTISSFKSLFNCTPEYGITLSVDYRIVNDVPYLMTGWKFRNPKLPEERATGYRSRRLGKPNKRSIWRKRKSEQVRKTA